MNVKINRKELLAGLQDVVGVAEKTTTMPILSCVLLSAEKDKLTISATEIKTSIIAGIAAETIEDGKVALPARKLLEIIKEIEGDAMIQMVLSDNGHVAITANHSRFKITGLPAEDFPLIGKIDDVNFVAVAGDTLRDLIAKTSFAMADDPHRSNLSGVYFEPSVDGSDKFWQMVATDGHRLAVAKSAIESPCLEFVKGVIIPRKGIAEIKKLVNGQEFVEIGFQTNMMVVRAGNTVLKVSLPNESYPDYKRVIPAVNEDSPPVSVDKEQFLRALKRMGVVSSDRYSSVVVGLEQNKMTLRMDNQDVGSALEDIDIGDYMGTDKQTGFNIHYMIEAVSAMGGERILFEMSEDLKPAMFKPAENSGDYFSVIMPLKI